MNILRDLNEKQIEAVTHKAGPLLVIAGPGTGKTKVITHRIEHLIREHNIRPEKILAITFTNKAAEEMQERINTEIGEPHGSSVKACTFHAFCVKVLRKHALKIGLSENFTIFDQELQDEILTESVRELNLNADDYPPWLLRNIISDAKCTLQNPVEAVDNTDIYDPETLENIRNVLENYQHKLDEYDALDFDDLLLKTVELLGVEEVKEAYHKDISYILVDEFHDVNRVQYHLLQLLCVAPAYNLMVVADEDQSIYSWRGSNPEYIDNFRADFDPRIVELDDHYRCSEKILRAAEEVISRNSERQKQHTLRTHKDAGRDIFHYTFDTPIAEARGIISVIENLVKRRNCSYRDIAIFYRTHRLADVLTEQLLRADIKFQRILPTNSFGEGSSKGILAYLRLIQWQLPQDLEQAINFPETYIDDLTWVRLKWIAQRKHIPFMELLKNIEVYPEDVGPLTRQNVCQFWTQLEELSAEIEGEKADKIIQKLFDALEHARSPYRAEELEVMEQQPEVPNLVTARDVLYSALDLDEPIQITASHGIDEYCAAHIIHQMLETYLDRRAELQFLPPDKNKPPQLDSGVHLLIGDFEELGEKGRDTRIILIGTVGTADSDAIHLETGSVRSIAALKLCQRLINRFESPNMADMVVYDLETTGINPKTAEIVEIAARRLNAIGDDVEAYYCLVKPPGGHIPRAATRVHQIDEETVKDAPGIEMVLPEFAGFIQDRILIGHNVAKYDNPILARDLQTYLKIGLSAPHYDTLVTARRLFPRQRCSIGALAEKFGIEHGRLHSALEDVRVNREIFKELIKIDAYKREVKSLTELLPLVGLGVLAKTETSQREVSTTEDTLTETDVYLNAAKRFVQTHNLVLPDRLPLEAAEAAEATVYIEELQDTVVPEFREDVEWRQRRVQFMNAVVQFESVSDEHQLTNFLDYQKLLTNIDELDDKTEQLTLMTLHAAKGTEFPVVIILGMEEGSFPMWKQNITEEEIEEERRLFYVGMTRAQNQLYLSTTVYRTGDRDRATSMFVREIPSNYVIKWPGPRHG
ncbi:UvrD-helicase domain-containing protein [Candidatus Poribacteria bacterium]|nr:UvrD-helicase domain-containing protein [Candidatus Poribacteria bacterium]